jgi:hypothetical protein
MSSSRAFPAGVRGGGGGAVDRDGRGAVTWRRQVGISLSGHIPVPLCSRCGSQQCQHWPASEVRLPRGVTISVSFSAQQLRQSRARSRVFACAKTAWPWSRSIKLRETEHSSSRRTELPGTRQGALLTALIDRIDVGANRIDIHFRPTRLAALLDVAPTPLPSATDDEIQILSIPVRPRRSGREIKLRIGGTTGACEEKPPRVCQGSEMPPILTAEHVVKRIAAECAFVADRGGVGIRLKPAATDCAAVQRATPRRHPTEAIAPLAESATAAVNWSKPGRFFDTADRCANRTRKQPRADRSRWNLARPSVPPQGGGPTSEKSSAPGAAL